MPDARTARKLDPVPTVAAILQLDDEGRPGAALTERLGEALYTSFLEAGPYARVIALRGAEGASERLVAAILELACTHDLIDVVLSIHTTARDPLAWSSWLRPVSGKLRLVYTTACHGDEAERAAWVAAGAQTVVSHVGFNNPIVAAPLFLSRWIGGASVEAAVSEAYREEAATTGVALSLPGAPPLADLGPIDRDPVAGSVPVITGDAALTIATGLPDVDPACPIHLDYDRERGGPLGLLLTGTAGRASLDGKELIGLAARGAGQATLPFPPERLAVLREACARVDEQARGRLELTLAEETRLKLGHGIVVTLDETVRAIPQRFDPTAPDLSLDLVGISVQWAAFWARLCSVRLTRTEDGYAVEVATKLFDLIPWRQSFTLGGGPPIPPAADGPRRSPVEGA